MSLPRVLAAVVCSAARVEGAKVLAQQPSDTSLMAEQAQTGMMKARYPFYHSSAELNQEAERLAQGCGGAASLHTVNNSEVSISVVHVKAKEASPLNRVFLMCGEHSRELIGPESCLHFLRQLCDEGQGSDREEALAHSEFQFILNANPRSRAKVEAGQYCVRENPSGVDLNRNWDEHFINQAVLDQTNPGPHAFSEPETQIFKQVVSEYKPTTFLSIHSGTLGMYMPWAYDQEHLASRNQQSMMQILKQLDEGHCHCPFGAAGKEVGYSCPGTSLDYVYDKMNTPYSFAFEIWVPEDNMPGLRERWQERVQSDAASLLEDGRHHLAHPHYVSLFQEHQSDFVATSASRRHHAQRHKKQHREHEAMDGDECFRQFNPDTKEAYDKVVRNWAAVYLETSKLVADRLRSDSVQAASTPMV